MRYLSKCIKFSCIFILFSTLFATSVPDGPASAFTRQVIQKGATGTDVIELQSRLQYLGFYKSPIDGVFGWNTYWALREFQEKYGLKVDGLAGLKTRKKLVGFSDYDEQWVRTQIRKGRDFTYFGGMPLKHQTKPGPRMKKNKATRPHHYRHPGQIRKGRLVRKAQNVPKGYSQNDIRLMANAVYGESRGEPFVGQVAVASVIVNRVESSRFPNSVAGVIYQPGAFTAVQTGQINLEPNRRAEKAVIDALNGWDPTGGALYYFNPVKATSGWIWSRPQIKTIGKHIFLK